MFQKCRGLKPHYIITENIKKSSLFFSKQMTKILLVEDDSSIATLYKFKLESCNYHCLHAENGLDALKALDTFHPDLVLLDLRMPVMDGETFLGRFRKKEGFENIPVIVLTNINRSEASSTLWHHGVSAYIIKAHTTPTEIVDTIEKHLKET